MSSLAFDTHRAVKPGPRNRWPKRSSRPSATPTGNVATKADIAASEAALRADIRESEGALRADLEAKID